jgi:hypothetical protein
MNEEKVYQQFFDDLMKVLESMEEADFQDLPNIPAFISNNVWDMLIKYQRMMMVTKEKFFEFLSEKRSPQDYERGIRELWDSIDHSYMDKAIRELELMTTTKDLQNADLYSDKKVTQRSIKLENARRDYIPKDYELYPLNPERDFITIENRYVNRHIKLYKNMLKRYKDSPEINNDLRRLVERYDKLDKTIPYFNKDGSIRCYNTIATYNSMLYNVNLLRSSWNRSIFDSKILDNNLWYLPAHPYACPMCAEYQGLVYTDNPFDRRYPQKESAIEGGVGHPNCKHDWLLYWSDEQIQDEKYNSAEWEEKYKIQQQIQQIDLTKSRLLADRRIYKNLGQEDMVDITTTKIKALRDKKNELEAQL